MPSTLSVLSLILLLSLTTTADTDSTTTTETAVTGYTSLCTSCIDFVEHLPGIQDSYEKGIGIDPNTLCTAVSQKMPSLSQPCFKLFADYFTTVQNATVFEICTTFYFC